jgi:argininosuccinate lyase
VFLNGLNNDEKLVFQRLQKDGPLTKKALLDLTLAELQAFHPAFGEDVFEAISLRTCVQMRAVPGGPAPEQVVKSIASGETLLDGFDAEQG